MIKYKTPEAFRIALESRIKSKSAGENIAFLRKRAAFVAFLKRVTDSGHEFALKGGFAMMLRFDVNARPSKDMDFVMRARRKVGAEELSPVLQVASALEEITETKAPDYFNFIIKGNPKVLQGAGYGSWRFQIEAKIGMRRFDSFHIDIALGDAWIDPMDTLAVDYFPLSGETSFPVRTISQPQQFAEKVHAYTLDREENSRVKDLVDMVLLIQSGLDQKDTAYAIESVFSARKTHSAPGNLKPPPETWPGPFLALAKTCGLDSDVDSAFQVANNFYRQTRD